MTDLPMDGRRSEKWQHVADMARMTPGQWVLAAIDAWPAQAVQMRNGTIAAFREGDWEVRARKQPGRSDTRKTDIFVKFLGD
jgi:hypothetical protein